MIILGCFGDTTILGNTHMVVALQPQANRLNQWPPLGHAKDERSRRGFLNRGGFLRVSEREKGDSQVVQIGFS